MNNNIRMLVEIPSTEPQNDSHFASDFEDAIQPFFPGVIVKLASTDHQDVRDFHHKFQVPLCSVPSLLDPATREFRVKFMQEELNEFIEANQEGSLHKAADALIDLAYVVHGTAVMMGLPWASLWKEVQRANMSKVRATDASQSKRGTSLDVIKPEGWKAPNFDPFLGVDCPRMTHLSPTHGVQSDPCQDPGRVE